MRLQRLHCVYDGLYESKDLLETLAKESAVVTPSLTYIHSQIEKLRAVVHALDAQTLQQWDRERNGTSITPPYLRPYYQEQLVRVPDKDGKLVVATSENLLPPQALLDQEEALYYDAIAQNTPTLLIHRTFEQHLTETMLADVTAQNPPSYKRLLAFMKRLGTGLAASLPSESAWKTKWRKIITMKHHSIKAVDDMPALLDSFNKDAATCLGLSLSVGDDWPNRIHNLFLCFRTQILHKARYKLKRTRTALSSSY